MRMGFLDKAKAAANDLAAKADNAMANSGLGGPGGGQPDKLFRDLGVLAFLEASGRPGPDGERDRILGTLREIEQRGGIPSFALQTAAPPPGSVPPPPGAAAQQAAQQAAQGQQSVPPAPSMAPPPAGAPAPQAPVAPSAPPPPPPSWARSDDA
jgi:hypothetical protein